VCGAACAFPAADLDTAQQQHAPQQPARPQIDWGKCPQLQPSENERQQKALVIENCLKSVPFPQNQNVTDEVVVKHREEVTTCALKTEGWFDQNGFYKFDRARNEIINKKLSQDVQKIVLEKHDACQKEAVDKFPSQYVNQVQMYQACMDFHISQICSIQVHQGGPPPQQQQQQSQNYQQGPPPQQQYQQQGGQQQQYYPQQQRQ